MPFTVAAPPITVVWNPLPGSFSGPLVSGWTELVAYTVMTCTSWVFAVPSLERSLDPLDLVPSCIGPPVVSMLMSIRIPAITRRYHDPSPTVGA